MESKHEYLENMSRRNNMAYMKISWKKKSWDDIVELVKGVIKQKLKFDTEVQIERAHHVGKPHAPFEIMKDGSRKKICPIQWLPDLHAGNRRKLFWKPQETSSQRKFVFSRTFWWRHCPMEWSFIPSYFVFIVYVCSFIFLIDFNMKNW